MNLGDTVDFWMPITPGKTMPTTSDSTQILINGHGSQLGRENWEELASFPDPNYNRTVQQFSKIEQPGRSRNPIEKNRIINQIAGSFTQALQNEGAGWDGSFLNLLAMTNDTASNGSLSMAERPISPNSHYWEPSSADFFLANQTHCSNSNILSSSNVLAGIPQYGFPVPYDPQYDLNSIPSIETCGASTVTNSFQFEPVTPNDKCTNEREKQQHDIYISADNVADVHFCGALSENIVDTSSAIIYVPSEEQKDAVISTSVEQPKNTSILSDEIIDLNKTPQQKTPKRRKHRPKVIVEGKSKRTPQAANMKTADPEKKASGKRKYVRKVQQESATSHPDSAGEITCSKEKPKEKMKYLHKDIKEPATENANNNGETAYATTRTAEPSCKRALNFESENVISERENSQVDQQKLLNKETETSKLSTGFQVSELNKPTDIVSRRESSLQMSQPNNLMLEKSEAISNLAPSMNLMPDNNASNSGRKEDGISYISVSNRMGADMNASSRDTRIRNQQFSSSDRTGMIFHFNPQSQFSPYLVESRRSKREYCQVMQKSHGTNNHLGQEMYHRDGYHLNSCMPNEVCSETRKKKKIENGTKTDIDGIFPFVAPVEHSRASASSNNVNSVASASQRNIDGIFPFVAPVNHSRASASSNNVNSVASASQRNSEILNTYLKRNEVRRENNESNRFPVHSCTHSVASGQDKSKQNMSGSRSYEGRTEENFRSIMLHTLSSANTFVSCNMLPPTPKASSRPGDTMQHTNCNIKLSKKQGIVPFQSQHVPSKECKMLQPEMLDYNDGQSPGKRKGEAAKQKLPVTVEDIIYQMESLSLNESKGNGKNALVPYKGDGTLIPYEGFIKKRKPRPKVDLDAETERVWKLLMWKEGSADQGTDEEKRKWWDEERRIFRGRADSFIARMHLVQGDRRFSKWKGSVVDSVIGVFLTQNVSDHLSSSAFMSLAARFPPKPTTDRMRQRDGTIILVEEPDVASPNLNDKLQEKLLHHPFYTHSSMTTHGLEEHQLESETSCTERTGRLKGYSHSPEEVLSSQDSFDSSIQSNGVRSYSGSNSEAEEPANGYKCNKNYNTGSADLQAESTTSFAEFYSHISGRSLFPEESRHQNKQPEDIEYRQQQIRSERPEYSHKVSSTFNQQINYSNLLMQTPSVPSSNYQFTTSHSGVLEVESLDSHREESISSWPSSTSMSSKEKDAGCTSKSILQGAENALRTMTTQYGSAMRQETPLVGSCRSQPRETNRSSNLESQSTNEPVNLADEQTNRQLVSNIPKLTGKVLYGEARIDLVGNPQTPSENKLVESGSNDQVTNKVNLNVKTVKARKDKGKAISEKKDTIDWDCLRKQAMANSERKGKSKDAMDSLDYEAMRRASVNQISDTIRERGMNNMLAERIKEFLDRLVREHGSVDLEWLRGVPPDKAKEYLLSIRGLGLKSVECVRLLTLHHLAFPVDTNVGRIAVRLGWVPLQPLPESLQLHLLELYPILESIQKYLWPRLCKLDQLTLYELHYQMITFGKVFCTKSRPNCNACPMRAECRHFASAFASARLALPGPEEKSIVTHTVPLTTVSGPGIIIDPMPLPPPEDNKLQRVGTEIVSCVPIIEEPATPEQELIELIESDIEDVFNDDTNEIPTIKLNMEELSENLQNYMQANMDLQEFDMSKALVALNPEAASIPTPKLKNISRLRTEHNVYELPDSHPLLNGMDKREPDDPSPYLLAIWTPGETAESIQPPGKNCQSQEPNKLCNEETCFSCNSIREANSQIVRGTLLIPCRTAMRGSFPLNGTYFQVNEMFADHASSLNPIDVPRAWIWNLPRRMVYFGTSVSTIFKGLSTEEIQYCFWRGFVCVRGFDQKTRAPRPLLARLHFPASKLAKTKNVT